MAQQTINIGTVANDGTGDPLRSAFDKVNDNFTELYSDDAGDVNSVSAGTGISVDQTTGAVTVTNSAPNATHTGDVTGATALTIANNAVDWAKLSTGFTGIDPVTQNDSFFFNGTDGYSIINVNITGVITTGLIGIGVGETRTALVTGGTSLTFGGDTSTYRIIAGEYDPAVVNFMQFFVADGAAGSFIAPQTIYITISQEA